MPLPSSVTVTDILPRGGGGTITFSDNHTEEFVYTFFRNANIPAGGTFGITLVDDRAELVYQTIVSQALCNTLDWLLQCSAVNTRLSIIEAQLGLPVMEDHPILQSEVVELTADISTTAVLPIYATMITTTVTTVGGDLQIHASASVNAFGGNAPVSLAVFLNGVRLRSTANNVTGAVRSFSLITESIAVAAAVHTVELRWATFTPFRTLFCRPVALPQFYHASLRMIEIGI